MLSAEARLRHPVGAARIDPADLPTMTSPSRRLLPTLGLVVAVAAGCDGCPSKHPYTPYTLDAGAPDGAAPAAAEPTGPAPAASAAPQVEEPRGAGAVDAGGGAGLDAGGGGGAPATGTAPPAGGKRWPLEGDAAVEAPTGRSFEAGLVLDADGDGARDLVAWARAPDGLRGELLFAPGARPREVRTLAALPGGLAGAGCVTRAALTQVRAATLALEIAPGCPEGQADPGTRWIAVIRGGAGAAPRLALELRVRAQASEPLELSFEAADRDGDGREDLAVGFSLAPAAAEGAAPPPRVSAPLWFLDRPAGLSRDASQPAAALRALAEALLAGAKRGEQAEVAARAGAVRRLYALLCEDAGGAPAVTLAEGPVRCGDPKIEAALARAEKR